MWEMSSGAEKPPIPLEEEEVVASLTSDFNGLLGHADLEQGSFNVYQEFSREMCVCTQENMGSCTIDGIVLWNKTS